MMMMMMMMMMMTMMMPGSSGNRNFQMWLEQASLYVFWLRLQHDCGKIRVPAIRQKGHLKKT